MYDNGWHQPNIIVAFLAILPYLATISAKIIYWNAVPVRIPQKGRGYVLIIPGYCLLGAAKKKAQIHADQ